METMTKLDLYPPDFPDLGTSDFFLYVNSNNRYMALK